MSGLMIKSIRSPTHPEDAATGIAIEAPDWFVACKEGDVVYNVAGMPILLFEPVHEIIVGGTGSYLICHGAKALFPDGDVGNLTWHNPPREHSPYLFQTAEEAMNTSVKNGK